jgi:spoIIIJ-associated protein
MTPNDSIETTAATIDQAINRALEQLGADQDDVEIEVLSTPRAGVLGLGARQARVRVTRRPPEAARSGVTSPPPAPPLVRQPQSSTTSSNRAEVPSRPLHPRQIASEPAASPANVMTAKAEPDSQIEATVAPGGEPEPRPTPSGEGAALSGEDAALTSEARLLLVQILELMGEKADIETVDEGDVDNPELNIKGDGSGLLIGRHGQTLDALEYVVNRILARKFKEATPVSIDTESYRARRRRQLHRIALSKGEQAKREHLAVMLEPMPPRDRRIVHLALKDDPLVTTRSSGEGFLRSIEIVPVEARREGPGARGRERARERERESGRDQSPPGQQGGFKHGQKKIV